MDHGEWLKVPGEIGRSDILIQESSKKDEEGIGGSGRKHHDWTGERVLWRMNGKTKIHYFFTQGRGNVGSSRIFWMLDQAQKTCFLF